MPKVLTPVHDDVVTISVRGDYMTCSRCRICVVIVDPRAGATACPVCKASVA